MKKDRIVIATVLCALLFVGSGCEEDDFSTVFDFLSHWSQAKDLTDENGKPTIKGIQHAVQGSGDPVVDAATDSDVATKGVREADAEMKAAEDALYNDKGRDYAKAEEHLNKAAQKRPNDYSVRNRQWALDLEQGRTGPATEQKKKQAEEAMCGTDTCKAAMYTDRINALTDSQVRLTTTASKDKECLIKRELRNSYVSLGNTYEIMSFNTYKTMGPGYQGDKARTEYSNKASSYLTEAQNINADLNSQCGGA